MDAGDLRIFEAVARLGGMNRAATELNTVQSNVTARIRALEDELGAPLFNRHSRGVALTAAGRRLLPYAARVRQLLEDARRAVADDGAPKGPLTIGSLEAIFGCVAAGLGITLLPRSLIGPVWRDGRVAVHDLPPAQARVDTTFIRRRDAFVSSALAAFLQQVRPRQARAQAAE